MLTNESPPVDRRRMLPNPAFAAVEHGLVNQHTRLAIPLVGAWRWPLFQKHRTLLLELATSGYVIDFGGAAGPVGYRTIIVDAAGPVTSLWDLPGQIQGIITSHTLEHIEDLPLLLRCMYEKIEPGGWLVIQVPGWKHPRISAGNWPGHVRTFRLHKHTEAPGGCVVLDDVILDAGFELKIVDEESNNLFVLAQRPTNQSTTNTAWDWPIAWRTDTIPPYDDGRLAIVVLREDCGLEHFGHPIIVSVWETKLKTTVEAIRIDREQVLRWALIPPEVV